ncbi:hypothetical protein F4825DRAFT_473811 [Nemania diffusa]|nr:hypothetical protein F4825DRAFT_473811 [Nemania diffusa]
MFIFADLFAKYLENQVSRSDLKAELDPEKLPLKDVQIRFNYERDAYSHALNEIQDLGDRRQVVVDGVPIATMATKIHLALKSLSSGSMLCYNGMLPLSELRQKLAEAGQSPRIHDSKICCKIGLSIFGPSSIKDALAKDLSSCRLFLQHPISIPLGTIYENPQYFGIVASPFRNGAILPPIVSETFQQGSSRVSPADLDESTTIATVLDNLPRPRYLGDFSIDKRVTTMLLSHQKEAVNFLTCRESTEKRANVLWRHATSISGELMYRHLITGSTSPKPNDILGGILGDGMGLGKTLSMIACIVSSLANTGEFADNSIRKSPQITMSPFPIESTLVIVPSVLLLDSWLHEIERHLAPGTLSVYKYHGLSRKLPSSSPLPYHIVLSTYGTVVADYSRGGGVLACFHWHRLILDEAHVIRNLSTQQFKAVKDLSASIRWCVTGTPVQNSLKDLASLVTFLRIPLLDDAAIFRKHIEGRREALNGVSKTNYTNLRHLLESICLRRCTSSILSSLGVSFIERRPQLSEGERKGYNELSILCDQAIETAVNGKQTRGENNSMLTAVLRLRMFCNIGHRDSMESLFNATENGDELMPDEVISLLQQCGEALCASCKTEISSPGADGDFRKQKGSAHSQLKCQECAQSSRNAHNTVEPSESFEKLHSYMGSEPMQDIQFEHNHASLSTNNASPLIAYPAKILSLIKDLKTHLGHDKSIVFSFWKRSLDLVEKALIEQGITFGRVDGTSHLSKRREVLACFQENPSIRVLLMTIGTGAIGLNNLSVASRVHILEPQWNPSIEDQAIGRVTRLGQTKNVSVIRYIVKNTIEESIESRQLQKLQLALKSGLKSSNRDLSEGKRRAEHLRALGRIIESKICTSNPRNEI